MPSTNFSRYARIPEVTRGVTPSAAVWQYATLLSEGMKPTDAFGRSESISSDRFIPEHLRLGQSAGGSLSAELSGGWGDWLLEMGLFARFGGGVEAFNVTADQVVTDVDATNQTIDAVGAWAPGMLILTEGLATGNNGVFKAAAGTTTDQITAPASTFDVAETTPAARARVLYVGFEGTSGDLVTAADGITSTTLDFTDFPIPIDGAVKIQGFDDASVDVFATVQSVAAGKLTLKDLPAGWTAGLGAGKTVRIYVAEVAESGATALTESHAKWNTKVSPIAYEKFNGVAINSLSIPFQPNAIVRPTAQALAFYGGLSETDPAASYQEPFCGVTRRPMKTGNNIARLTEGGAALASAACTQSLSFTLNNGLTPQACLAHDAPVDWNEGDAECIVEAQFRFASKAIFEKYYLGTASSVLIGIKRDTWAYMFKLHYGVYTDGGAVNGGRNQDLTLQMRLEGSKDPTTGKLLTVSRFRYFT